MRNRFALAALVAFFFALGSRSLLAQAPAATPDENPEGDTGALKAQVQTGGSYDIQSGNATRIVNDLHVPGALGGYGLDFTRYWNSLHPEDTNPDAQWPQDFGDSGWSHSWKWSAVYGEEVPDFEQDPWPHKYITSITITFPDGHATKFKIARTDGGYGGNNIDPRCGPPYSNPGETDWPLPGAHVHDHLVSMALDGHEFWLSRADGGSVHFVGVYSELHNGHAWWSYEAQELFDPHGLRTDLIYQGDNLTEVRQEGGRSLLITWGEVGGVALPVIASVDSKGPNGEQLQHVSYWYAKCGGAHSGHSVLSRVIYEDESAPGQQPPSAIYTYSMNYGDEANGTGQFNSFPLLKTADDPHFAGAMTKISYKYWGNSCTTRPPANCGVACMNWPHFPAETIVAERSMDRYNTVVSSFDPVCETGSRKESSGIGASRWFYFGQHDGIYAWGYELTSETDFYQAGTNPQNPIRRRQDGSEPGTVWDGRGILTQMAWADDSGSPSEIQYVDGSTCAYDRNPPSGAPALDSSMHNSRRHWLFKKKDERGQWTIYTRDSRRRVTRIDYPDGSYETYSYDNGQPNGLNQVTEHRLPSGAIETFEYDSAHRLVRASNSVDRELHGTIADKVYTYDTLGRVATMIEGRAASSGAPFTTRMTYNGRHQVMSVEYAAVGGQSIPTVRYEYDSYGNCTAIVDELGHRKDYIYDDYRRCTSYTEQVNGPGPNGTNVPSRRWDWIYDRVLDNGASFRNTAHTSKDWRIQIEPEFNANHDRRAIARTFAFNNRIITEQTGLVQHAGEPLGTLHTVDGVTGIQRFTYDENGQKQTSTDPLGRITTYGYDNRNRLQTTTEPKRASQPANPVTRFDYDAAGNKRIVTFPDNKTQQWDDYDAFGQAWKFTDERHNVTDLIYCWGPMKKLYKVTTHRLTDSGSTEHQLTTFSYDPLGRSKQTLFPDGSDEFSNHEFGQLSTWKTRRNQTKRIHYDARGREDYHTWDNGAAPGINRVWDPANRLTSMTNAFSSIDYTYDDASQAITEGSTVAGSGARRQLIYWRYPSGEVSRLTYPDGSTVNRGYTARGQLDGVNWNNGTMSTSYAYLADGKMNYQARSNGVTTSYAYDGRGIVSSISDINGGGLSLAYREYWRDDRDRIRAWKRGGVPGGGGPNGMEDGRGDRYDYDDEGQLTAASYRVATPEGTPGTALRTDVFNYDALGNRMGANRVASRGPVNFARRDNGLNQYLNWTPAAIYYDDNFGSPYVPSGNGVMMAEGWITASFNALNQPMAIWSPACGSNFFWFGFDPLGRCVKRWTGTATGVPVGSNPITYYYYDGWNLVQEGPGGTLVDRTYVHGGRVDEIGASQVSGIWYNHHYDGQGNCTMLTAGTPPGAIQEQYDYDAFGFPYFYSPNGNTLPSPPRTRFLFTGREWLSDLRIYDYRARQYQPELGRFLQPDPKEFAAGDYNLYRYCHNDPVNKTDPTGLDGWQDNNPKLQARIEEMKKAGKEWDEKATPTFNLIAAAVMMFAPAGKVEGAEMAAAAITKVLSAESKLVASAKATEVAVTHFTNAEGAAGITQSGVINVGSYVTTSSTAGMSASKVESFLEVGAGKGAFSTSVTTSAANLGPAAGGPLTSGGAAQYQLINPVTAGPFVPTP
jgi:RHS repeat-associated protein